MMKRCTQCVLPETYPGINFNEEGICNYCTKPDSEILSSLDVTEKELIKAIKIFKNNHTDKQYDCLICLSGGVDSSFALIRILENYKLRPLGFHNDHGFEDPIATENVKKLCRQVDVDLFIFQHEIKFMSKLWRYINTSKAKGISACWVCGTILFINAIEMALKLDIPMVVNGYSKGQVHYIKDQTKNLDHFMWLYNIIKKAGDDEFLAWFKKKFQVLFNHKMIESLQDLCEESDKNQVLVVPFYLFKFNQANKDKLMALFRERIGWQKLDESYPGRTTNCKMVVLNVYMELLKHRYSLYDTEYAELIRKNEMSREQALKDLNFTCSMNTVKSLAENIGLHIEGTHLGSTHIPKPKGTGDHSE